MKLRQFTSTIFLTLFLFSVASAQNRNAIIDSSRFNGQIQAILVQRDGKIIIGGNFSTYNKQDRRGIIRLNADGSADKSFSVGGGFNNTVNALALQSDGKIVAGGTFSNYDGTACNRIVRLNSDGSIDNSLVTGIGFKGEINALAVQSDGKILVGGMLSNFNGIACGGLVRLNSNGSLDQNFVYLKGISGYVYSISLLSNGKIMAGGYFDHFDRALAYGIVRLNSDGSLDNSFATRKGFGTGSVTAMLPLSNGKVIVAGNFKSYNDTPCHFITRLNSDGSLDKSFATPGQPTKEYSGYGIFSLALQSDGKIIAAGKFDYYNTTLRQCILRINADGSLDNSFGSETGFDNKGHGAAVVNAVALTASGNILAGGGYKRYDSESRNNITALDKNGKLIKTDFNTGGL